MLELILGIIMVVTVGKIASVDGQSGILWGAVALGLGILCVMFVPIAYGRILLAAILAIIAMVVYKVVAKQ